MLDLIWVWDSNSVGPNVGLGIGFCWAQFASGNETLPESIGVLE